MPTLTKAAKAVRDKTRKRVWGQKKTADKSEVGEPDLTDEQRKEGDRLRRLCRKSLLNFNVLCFPRSTGLKPFGTVQLDSISQDQDIILHGGRALKLEPRGFAKTSRSVNAALWATLYNYRKMTPIFKASVDQAKTQIMEAWKTELLGNDLLYWMFPYLIWPFRKLGDNAQGAKSLTYRGKQLRLKWLSDRIVLPTIKGQPASGNILLTLPLESARGASHKLLDGTTIRPELCIFDDVQKDEDAANPNSVEKMESLIDHTAMMLGGHSKTMSAIMNGTVRHHDDLYETYCLKSAWRHTRYKMLEQPAKHEKDFWLGQYADTRNDYDNDIANDQRRAQKACLALYKKNRKLADEGAIVNWEWAYAWDDTDPVQISAIQKAYDVLIDLGEDVFASECQNQPISMTGGLTILRPSEMMAKQSGYPRRHFPRECTALTAFLDVHEQIHYWEVWAWEPNFTGYMIDWGTMPDQHRRHFKHDMLAVRLDRFYKGMDDAARITAGLDAALLGSEQLQVEGLLRREWIRGDGVPMRIAKCGVDANGLYSDAIKKFIRQRNVGGVMYPSFGSGVKATQAPMSRWTQAKGGGVGPEWVYTKGKVGDPIGIMFDTNFWKTQFHRKLALPNGSQGATYLYRVDTPEEHRLAADHYHSERPKEVIYGSRVVYEFPSQHKGDNHRFDCAVGNLVAASRAGIKSVPTKRKEKEQLSLAELQRRRWAREGRT